MILFFLPRLMISRNGSTLRLVFQNRRIGAVFTLLFFCSLLTGLTAFFLFGLPQYLLAFEGLNYSRAFLIIIASPLLLVPIFMAVYYTLISFRNSITIAVTPQEITVENGPVPVERRKQVDVSHIVLLFCRRRYGKQFRPYYAVIARLLDGTEQDLITLFANPTTALKTRDEIERFLGLTHTSIPGEFIG